MIVAVANQKGGVGKTTTAVNLAAAFGALERPVLLVDCDPQGNATRGLGAEASPPQLYDVLGEKATMEAAIRPSGFPGMDLVPADRELVGVEVELPELPDWRVRLRRALRPVAERYHYVLLDSPPSLGVLTVSTLAAADAVLVPLQCEYLALEGVSELLATVRRIQGGINPGLELLGILLTMHDERTNLSRDVAEEVRRHFGRAVFETVVPRNVRLAEAPSHGLPVLHYDIKSRGAEAYLGLARELLSREAP